MQPAPWSDTLETIAFITMAKINQANRAVFELHLSRVYRDLFANDPDYAYSASVTTPDMLAYKMTLSLAKNEGNKDGEGIKRACKIIGIKHTYKAISEYLNAPEADIEIKEYTNRQFTA